MKLGGGSRSSWPWRSPGLATGSAVAGGFRFFPYPEATVPKAPPLAGARRAPSPAAAVPYPPGQPLRNANASIELGAPSWPAGGRLTRMQSNAIKCAYHAAGRHGEGRGPRAWRFRFREVRLAVGAGSEGEPASSDSVAGSPGACHRTAAGG